MRKGQAAMEFLMTYGWAILVVIAAIAALAYFGVLDPAKLLPERCQSSAGMDCIDKANVKTATLELALRNNIGFGVTVTGANVSGCAGIPSQVSVGSNTTYFAISDTPVSNNEVFRIRLWTCTNGAVGDKFDDTITVAYTSSETGLDHDVLIDIRGRVS